MPAARPKTAPAAKNGQNDTAEKPAETKRPKAAETRPIRSGIETAKIKEGGQNAAEVNTAAVSANQKAFLAIVERHNLTAEKVAEIVGRRKVKTVSAWLSDQGPEIPVKQLRILRRWSDSQPRIRMVAKGGGR